MKQKILGATLCVLMALANLCGCGKISEEAQAVVDKINSIGEVDYDDEVLIGEIEDAYLALTADQQEEVNNFDILVAARETMNSLIAAKPIPFSSANWETTQEELKNMLGDPAEEHDHELYGHVLSYGSTEYDGYTGTIEYLFQNGVLTRVFFIIKGYDEEAVNYFQELYAAKYGEPTYVDDYGTKRWDTENVSVVIMSGNIFGGYVDVIFMSPNLGTEE